ncbi:MAG: YwbE family protein [Eubacteriales bacterium]|nr:YwbE family protein [Eubacteriales bacterium]
MNGQKRADIFIGAAVRIVRKADQPTGRLTEGTVMRILTNSSFHPHGIKVMLVDGQVGRVQQIVERPSDAGGPVASPAED